MGNNIDYIPPFGLSSGTYNFIDMVQSGNDILLGITGGQFRGVKFEELNNGLLSTVTYNGGILTFTFVSGRVITLMVRS